MAGGLNLLKEQVEANQAAMENSKKELEIKHDQLSMRQDELDTKMDSVQTSVNALQSTFNTQFAWIRQLLDPKGEKGVGDLPPIEPTQKGLLETPMVKLLKASSYSTPEGTEGSGVKKLELTTTLGGNQYTNYKAPKYEFPKFDGDDDVIDWLQQCNCFFLINPMPMNERVMFTSLYLSGKARKWLFIRFKSLADVSWELFKKEITKRFANQGYYNVVADLHELKQAGSVEEYQNKFEDLRNQVLEKESNMTETYFISAFIGGLQPELKNFVYMLKPSTLEDAVTLARLQESGFNSLLAKAKTSSNSKQNAPSPATYRSYQTANQPTTTQFTYKPSTTTYSPTTKPDTKTPSLPNKFTTPNAVVPVKKITPAEMQARREKGLCYNCDEQYTYGHKCKRPQVYHISGEEEKIESDGEMQPEPDEPPTDDNLGISMHAIAGGAPCQTLVLQGQSKKVPLSILVDSGSSHNFLDPLTAKQTGCKVIPTTNLQVTIADGSKTSSKAYCPDFQWCVQGEEFTTNMRILPLGGYNMILGVDWLKKFGPVTLDLNNLTMNVMKEGRAVTLQGGTSPYGELKVISGGSLYSLCSSQQCGFIGQLSFVAEDNQNNDSIPIEVTQLLDDYDDLFKEPKGLPPPRAFDHQIPLKPGAAPFSIRPYQYPHVQKNEIEKLVKEMLESGIIRPSTSPFASPVLLVKKKDGSWRLCIDYRELNSLTIKNKFPTPVIDELLEELHGAAWFSKLDLRSGYHQIRMQSGDISKTAFQTHEGHYEFLVMPFGLTNAPASFQALMNQVFKPYLRRFILVFFDDILIYSKSLAEHIEHLKTTFDILRQNTLFVKMSKCSFAQPRLEYLGHIISQEGVAADEAKVSAMITWPTPKNVKALRGFLGLTGYYRKFVRGYGIITKPLTQLLKKNQFQWSEEATRAFETLKRAISTTPVLALPDFAKPFIVEIDASQEGIGAVLMQQGRPIAFLSKALPPRKQCLSAYERELWALIYAVHKWRTYLFGHHFLIKTDHQSLKFLLEQRVTSMLQQKWLTKLMGLDYTIVYKRGCENKVADALSRREFKEDEDAQCNALTTIQPAWLSEVSNSWTGDELVQTILAKLLSGSNDLSGYTFTNDTLRYKGRLYIGVNGDLRQKIIQELHHSGSGGHSRTKATLKRIEQFFYWPNMITDVTKAVKECLICQRSKSEHVPYPGLLQPLPIPTRPWNDIAMDFIEGLPNSDHKNSILVVIDRFSKYAHFFPLSHPYTAQEVAALFFANVHKLHGLPATIVSDRDPIFLSQFWSHLFKLLGTKLCHSTSYHPQTDGQTERLNQCLETFLRCMTSDKPKQWAKWIPLAEWWYNTTYHSSLQLTPFEVVYGYPPPHLSIPQFETHKEIDVQQFLQERKTMMQCIRDRLQEAQHRMKQFADRHRSERTFVVGDWVFLRLQPYKQTSLSMRKDYKLAPRFYGPYKVLEKIGSVAYRLQLPSSTSIHPVFHVSMLKKKLGHSIEPSSVLPPVDSSGHFLVEPVAILDRRLVRRGNASAVQVQIQWSNMSPAEATWEDYDRMKELFPNFDP
ncbi:hypothetical protein LguiA_021594 [Lonicera macranthoides]